MDMKKKNHITFAAIFVLVFILTLEYFNIHLFKFTADSIFIIALLTIFYSVLPDIDHKNSTITWWFFGLGVLGLVSGLLSLALDLKFFNSWILIIVSTIILVATYLAVNLFSHRGFIHSIPVGLVSVIPLFFIFYDASYCIAAYVAWHSHLVGDGYLLKFK